MPAYLAVPEVLRGPSPRRWGLPRASRLCSRRRRRAERPPSPSMTNLIFWVPISIRWVCLNSERHPIFWITRADPFRPPPDRLRGCTGGLLGVLRHPPHRRRPRGGTPWALFRRQRGGEGSYRLAARRGDAPDDEDANGPPQHPPISPSRRDIPPNTPPVPTPNALRPFAAEK